MENLEIKQEILSELEIEECIKNLKVYNENEEDEQDEKFKCYICLNFAHNPINCSKCKFKACEKCFDEHK